MASRRRSPSDAAPYQEYLDRLHRRMRGARGRRGSAIDVVPSIASRLPGLFPLVGSLASAAINVVDDHQYVTVQEWNAFSSASSSCRTVS